MTSGLKILASGNQPPTDIEASVQSVLEGLDGLGLRGDAAHSTQVTVAVVAERLANLSGASLVNAGFGLFDTELPRGSIIDVVAERLDSQPLRAADAPYVLGRLYELLLAPEERQRSASHLTSAAVTKGLVACLDAAVPGAMSGGPARVLDPAVGGAAFLLAAATAQVDAGNDADAVFDLLFGMDIDRGAVAVAEAALGLWLIDHGRAPRPNPRLVHGDGLVDELPRVDVVVGNPPFRNQLQRSSARSPERRERMRARWGALAGAYTDDAWLFVAAGMAALDGGSLAMIQPLSILSARHGEPVRSHIAAGHWLAGLWVPFAKVFDAAVDVCGLVVNATKPETEASVQRWFGEDFEARPAIAPDTRALASWGPLAAEMQGVPFVIASRTDGAGTLQDLASSTAGFRDQFYGLKPFVHERASAAEDVSNARLVTVGMIDPLVLRWGRQPFAFAGDRYLEPVLDLRALATADPTLMAWVQARQRPKLLVATQTRIVETWVDADGTAVPATPVISVEPHAGDDLWRVCAVLNAPFINAALVGNSFGSALSINAMKFSAQQLTSLPLPTDTTAWEAAAELLRTHAEEQHAAAGILGRAGLPGDFAALMTRAYADTSDAADWWLGRLLPVLDRHR